MNMCGYWIGLLRIHSRSKNFWTKFGYYCFCCTKQLDLGLMNWLYAGTKLLVQSHCCLKMNHEQLFCLLLAVKHLADILLKQIHHTKM